MPCFCRNMSCKWLPLLILLLVLPVHSIRCGKRLTTPCLGDTDKRYDPDYGNAAADQAEIWKKFPGYYVGAGATTYNGLGPGFVPIPPVPDNDTVTAPTSDFYMFSLEGSRLSSRYVTVDPPPNSFGLLDTYATTTYEKDGVLLTVPRGKAEEATEFLPVDTTGFYATASEGVVSGSFVGFRILCLDSDCTQLQTSSDIYRTINSTVERFFTSAAFFTRVSSMDEWVQAIDAEYIAKGIPEDQRVNFSDPASVCLTPRNCPPSEEEWCSQDPSCSVSPFQEPAASVKGGVVAGFAVLGAVLLALGLYCIHRYLVAKQAVRYRTKFAKRVADTINVRGSIRSMNPRALAEEFERIDAGVKDGKLSKEKLWEFLSSGKAGDATSMLCSLRLT